MRIIQSAMLKDTAPPKDDDYDMTEPRDFIHIVETRNPADTQGRPTEDDDREIREYFRLHCHCQHDCCGHRNGGVSFIRPLYDNRFVVLVHTYRNY